MATGHRLTCRQVVLCVLVLSGVALRASALEVDEVRWGFAGTAVPERVNLLSVLLRETDGRTFDGDVRLHKELSPGRRLGAQLVQPCYLAPYTSRWVQFYPYVAEPRERWVLTAGRRSFDVPSPRPGAPAVVHVADEPTRTTRATGVPSFAASLFPPAVTATDGLYAVVLDHAPRWEAPRREAFTDWLRRGGTVHVVEAAGGGRPEFEGELAVLNGSDGRLRVGSGLVVRHALPAREITAAYLAEQGFALPALADGATAFGYDFAGGLFRVLRELVNPEHNWALIFGVLVVYLVCVCPVNYLIGRKVRDFRVAIGFAVACFVGFSLLLSALGRRGYGESAAVHALSYARPVGATSYDVTQWINAFAVRGDYYTIEHPGAHSIYSTCQTVEAVNGLIESGPRARFLVDVPLYSSRSFLHRGLMDGPDLGVRVAEWPDAGRLDGLRIAVGEDFPESLIEGWALHRDRFYPLRRGGEGLDVRDQRGTTRDRFLRRDEMNVNQITRYSNYPTEGKDAQAICQGLLRLLIARATGGTDDLPYRIDVPGRDDDTLELFLFAESPEGFRLRRNPFGREAGYVLYHLCLHVPEGTDE